MFIGKEKYLIREGEIVLKKNLAKQFAKHAHEGQKRKNSDVPYVTHPIRVAERLENTGASDELICAGYLHDVVEDTLYTIADIERHFGPKVAKLVAAHTEDKSKSWQERKEHTIKTLKHADKEVKYLIVADKLDNILDLEKDIQANGAIIWEKFNASIEKQRWYNQAIAENMYKGLAVEETPVYFKEFAEAVDRVFG